MKEVFYFPSSDGVSRLHAIRWPPDGEVRAILQIVHGMSEHIERYDEFARFLAMRGVLVVGHSHLGHGKSVKCDADLGYFAEPDGNACLIADIHALRQRTWAEHKTVPYFILGHSMGSFLTRQYLGVHGAGLAGAIIMGTSDLPDALVLSARKLCTWMAKHKGWNYRSKLIDGFIIRGYERRMGMEWLSKNAESTAAYASDPLCGFAFTLNGYYNFFTGVHRANRQEAAGDIPMGYPILFTAGAEDPVGSNGRGVETLCRRYRKLGARVKIKLYSGMRHEILNELDRFTVYEDIYTWMNRSESRCI